MNRKESDLLSSFMPTFLSCFLFSYQSFVGLFPFPLNLLVFTPVLSFGLFFHPVFSFSAISPLSPFQPS